MALIRRLIDPRFLSTTRSTTKATVTAPKIDDVVPLIRPKQKSEAGAEAEAQPKAIPPPKPHAAFMDDDPIEAGDRPVLSYAAPYDSARAYARRHCWQEGSLATFAWGDKFWEWDGRIYEEIAPADLRARVYGFLDGSCVRGGPPNFELSRYRPKPTHVSGVVDGLGAGLALPSWAEPPMHLDTGLRAGDVLMFKNGLLDLRTGERVPATPKHWIHRGLNYPWKPDALCPDWDAFLERAFPGDQQSKDAIEEGLGLSMTEDIGFQKGFLLIGKPRSGKGTILRVGEALTGSYVSMDLDKWLADDKASEPLIGRKMIAFPDVRLKEGQWYGLRFDPGGLSYKSVQHLLKIVAGDKITLGRKYISAWEGVLFGKVWFVSNKYPNFNDPVLPTRWIVIAFEVSYAGREDLTLSDRLIANELSGIAARCLAKYHLAKARGKLTQPTRGLRLSAEVAKSSDAFTQFMMETFVFDVDGLVSSPVAYQKLVRWCGSHGRADLLERIKSQNLRRYMRAVPGFEGIEKGPRPHGEDRTIAKIRLRTKEEREKDFDDDD